MTRPIALAAGGTGGHVFPAQALAAELAGRGATLALITDGRGGRFAGAVGAIHTVRAGTVSGRGLVARLCGLAAAAAGVIEARRLMRRLRPAAVVGFGGYASLPTVLAASHIGIPTVIHEQNTVLGRANRLLAPRVDALALGFAETSRIPAGVRTIHTGNPVRPAVAALAGASYAAPAAGERVRLLVLGGSQGARVMAEVVPAALGGLEADLRRRLDVAQQCRAEDAERVAAAYARAGIVAELSPFFADVPERLARAHLVVSRAGASSIAEITAVGRPSVLVPYPHAADDHQAGNARAVAEAGGGWAMAQEGFTAAALAERVAGLMAAPERLVEAAERARAFAVPDAAARLADVVLAAAAEGRAEAKGLAA